MSKTLTDLAATAMANALEHLTGLYANMVEVVTSDLNNWVIPRADNSSPVVPLEHEVCGMIGEMHSIALLRHKLAELIRKRPDVIDLNTGRWPGGSSLPIYLVALGDATTFTDIKVAIDSLDYAIGGSPWDLNDPQQQVVDKVEDNGFSTDLGDVVPLEQPEPPMGGQVPK
jgi:hypothetical protein